MSRPAALDRVQIAGLGDSLGDLAEQARAAEAAGIDCVWAVELFRSSLTQAMWLAASTETVGVGTGIAWGFTRSPMILALSALDIDEASGGRFRLGLGAGVKRLNETWHGVEYGRPAPHLRETVEAVRLIIESAGGAEPIRYEGSYHDIDIKGWIRPHPKVRESIPIYTAAVQEGMARVAGDVADGMIGHPMCSMRWLDEVLVDQLRARPEPLQPGALQLRLPADRLLRDRRRRGGRDRGRPAHDRLLRDRAHVHAALGDARLRRAPRPRSATRSAAATSRTWRATSPTRWSTPTRPRDRWTRSASGSRRSPSVATGSGSGRRPTSWRPEQIAAYQQRIVEAFGRARTSRVTAAALRDRGGGMEISFDEPADRRRGRIRRPPGARPDAEAAAPGGGARDRDRDPDRACRPRLGRGRRAGRGALRWSGSRSCSSSPGSRSTSRRCGARSCARPRSDSRSRSGWRWSPGSRSTSPGSPMSRCSSRSSSPRPRSG